MDVKRLNIETSKITKSRQLKSIVLDFLTNEKGISYSEILNIFEKLEKDPLSIPIEDLKMIFEKTGLDSSILEGNANQEYYNLENIMKKIDNAIFELMEIRKMIEVRRNIK